MFTSGLLAVGATATAGRTQSDNLAGNRVMMGLRRTAAPRRRAWVKILILVSLLALGGTSVAAERSMVGGKLTKTGRFHPRIAPQQNRTATQPMRTALLEITILPHLENSSAILSFCTSCLPSPCRLHSAQQRANPNTRLCSPLLVWFGLVKFGQSVVNVGNLACVLRSLPLPLCFPVSTMP